MELCTAPGRDPRGRRNGGTGESGRGVARGLGAGAEGGASFHLLPRESQALTLSHPEKDRESFHSGPELGGRRA